MSRQHDEFFSIVINCSLVFFFLLIAYFLCIVHLVGSP